MFRSFITTFIYNLDYTQKLYFHIKAILQIYTKAKIDLQYVCCLCVCIVKPFRLATVISKITPNNKNCVLYFQWEIDKDMMNNCFICSRESYDFERHGDVSCITQQYFTSLHQISKCKLPVVSFFFRKCLICLD